LLGKIFELKAQNKVIGFTASTWDVLHPGHVVMLAEAKSRCDYLVVGLLTDPTIDRPETKNKPVQTTFERWVQIAGVEFIDMIIPFDTEKELEDMLLTIKPDIRIVGEEYKETEFTGKWIDDIEIYYNKRSHSFSSSELRDRVYKAGKPKETTTVPTAPKED
jgi:glycerol-3-phosphate cytidylyltransferase